MFEFAEKVNRLGIVLFAPLRVKLWEGRIREPDIVFLFNDQKARRGNKFWTGADLAVEVVSEDDPHRDLVTKRDEYARAKIEEYWIVDPRDRTVLVLTLDEPSGCYIGAGNYATGSIARSVLLHGFTVDVKQLFSQS